MSPWKVVFWKEVRENLRDRRTMFSTFVLGTLIEDNPVWGVVKGLIGIFEPSFKDVNFAPIDTDPMPDKDVTCNTTTGFCYFK